MPHIIRRYMDYRNQYQSKAVRQRSQNDVDELQEQHKWLEWDQFSALIARLRSEWEVASAAGDGAPTVSKAELLHDLLLLGLYSCVPGRGNEVRLLQYIPEQEVRTQMAHASSKITSLKKWVDKEKINLITSDAGVWKMVVSQYKNYRLRGVDVTELTASK